MYSELSSFELRTIERYVPKTNKNYYDLISYIEDLLEERYENAKKETKTKAVNAFRDLIDDKFVEKGTILN